MAAERSDDGEYQVRRCESMGLRRVESSRVDGVSLLTTMVRVL